MIATLTRWLGRTTDEHPGADNDWADLLAGLTEDTRAPGRHRADDDQTVILRRPIAAITAAPHWPVIDPDLGPLTPGPLEPARIHDALTAVNGVNTGRAL